MFEHGPRLARFTEGARRRGRPRQRQRARGAEPGPTPARRPPDAAAALPRRRPTHPKHARTRARGRHARRPPVPSRPPPFQPWAPGPRERIAPNLRAPAPRDSRGGGTAEGDGPGLGAGPLRRRSGRSPQVQTAPRRPAAPLVPSFPWVNCGGPRRAYPRSTRRPHKRLNNGPESLALRGVCLGGGPRLLQRRGPTRPHARGARKEKAKNPFNNGPGLRASRLRPITPNLPRDPEPTFLPPPPPPAWLPARPDDERGVDVTNN